MNVRIFLQFHTADRSRAMEVARLIADIEPRYCPSIELIFAYRFDCEPPDNATLYRCVQKMAVSQFKTKTKWYGWPAGPNGMAVDCMMEAKRCSDAGIWAANDLVLLLEPDVCPLSLTWIDDLLAEWHKARAEHAILMGSWRNSGGAHGHINGNCGIIPNFANVIRVDMLVNQDTAWDCVIAPYVKDRWYITGLIKNVFQTEHIMPSEIEKPEVGDRAPVLIHGIKSSDALDYAKHKLLENYDIGAL